MVDLTFQPAPAVSFPDAKLTPKVLAENVPPDPEVSLLRYTSSTSTRPPFSRYDIIVVD